MLLLASWRMHGRESHLLHIVMYSKNTCINSYQYLENIIKPYCFQLDVVNRLARSQVASAYSSKLPTIHLL